jgi:predicted lipoprotein with Yx(FWY)xxD motif
MPLLALSRRTIEYRENPMIKTMRWPVAVLAALVLAACQSMTPSMSPVPGKAAEGVLTEPNGMTLYTYAKDVPGSGKSACNGACALAWPPFLAGAYAKGSGNWTLITRDDGRIQWAYKGRPVYTYMKDTKPGDKSGHNYNGEWFWATE